jgi:hypothetical protein
MSELPIIPARRCHRSRAEADQLVVEYEASNLSRDAFCREHQISLKSLARYVTRYRRHAQAVPAAPRWLPVEIAPPVRASRNLAVVLANGRHIEVSPGFDTPTLQQLVRAVEAA